MSGRGPSDNRAVVESPASLLGQGSLPHPFGRDGGPGCFMTTTTMRWRPAALRKGGLV
jgi:hypothetical protein